MHIFGFIKYCHPLIWGLQIPGTIRFQGLFVIPVLSKQWTTMLVDTMLTAYYYKSPVISRHVGWSYQLHVLIGWHDLRRMVFVLSAMILHMQYIYEYTRSSWRRSCPSFWSVWLVVIACLEYELSNLITLLVSSAPS